MKKLSLLLMALLLMVSLVPMVHAEDTSGMSVPGVTKDAYIEDLLVYYRLSILPDGSEVYSNHKYRQYTFVNGYTDSTRWELVYSGPNGKIYDCYVTYTFY